ncbi:MAG: hypothetical protein D3923_12520, partial [Candidatus Electrothrix sp. AR3]|nr:hypothetical protein [Candidatus Electrothrix sp. AR3]
MLCRQGGVSLPPFASLNLSFSVGDAPEAVAANRQLLKEQYHIQHLVSAVQVHGKQVILVEDVGQDVEYQGA